jgi:hypothetical protein
MTLSLTETTLSKQLQHTEQQTGKDVKQNSYGVIYSINAALAQKGLMKTENSLRTVYAPVKFQNWLLCAYKSKVCIT